jgi:hypothetical protein
VLVSPVRALPLVPAPLGPELQVLALPPAAATEVLPLVPVPRVLVRVPPPAPALSREPVLGSLLRVARWSAPRPSART